MGNSAFSTGTHIPLVSSCGYLKISTSFKIFDLCLSVFHTATELLGRKDLGRCLDLMTLCMELLGISLGSGVP